MVSPSRGLGSPPPRPRRIRELFQMRFYNWRVTIIPIAGPGPHNLGPYCCCDLVKTDWSA
jgi:hypothetical protein